MHVYQILTKAYFPQNIRTTVEANEFKHVQAGDDDTTLMLLAHTHYNICLEIFILFTKN